MGRNGEVEGLGTRPTIHTDCSIRGNDILKFMVEIGVLQKYQLANRGIARPRGRGTHILRHTGMCCIFGVSFLKEIPKHGSHFLLKILNYGFDFHNLANPVKF